MHIPDSIKKIGAGAFAFCKGVRELVIPDSVEEISHHAFGDCKGLKRAIQYLLSTISMVGFTV